MRANRTPRMFSDPKFGVRCSTQRSIGYQQCVHAVLPPGRGMFFSTSICVLDKRFSLLQPARLAALGTEHAETGIQMSTQGVFGSLDRSVLHHPGDS